jgi:hypothetical protein
MKSVASSTRAEARLLDALARVALGIASACVFLLGSAARGQEVTPPPRKVSEGYPLPDPKRVFRLETEGTLRERMAREAREGINPLNLKYEIAFPEYPPVTKEAYAVRKWAPLSEIVDPPFVCYQRLYFEQINSERYGWDLGPLQPLLCGGIFCFDVATLPYHAATEPLRRYECNSGYPLPGDPVPLLLYSPELNWPGIAGEATAIGLLFVFFP